VSPVPGRLALQPERTALAWQRTAVTAVVVLMPVVLVGLRSDLPALAVAAALAAVVSGGVVVGVARRLRELADDARGYPPFVPVVQVAAVTTLGAVGGLAAGVALAVR
jgi:uncharacterized membrane protein YidH (DUF202 family)